MSLRHLPRQSDRDPRPHDPPPPSHIMPHPPAPSHLNGGAPTPAVQNGSNIVSPAVSTAVPNGASSTPSIIHKLNVANEQTWLLIGIMVPEDGKKLCCFLMIFLSGRVAEQMGDLEHALSAYENALRHNPMSLSGLTQVAGIARIKENYPKVCWPAAHSSAGLLGPPLLFACVVLSEIGI